MLILFLHGWHSVLGGVKPAYLQDHGHGVLNHVLDDDDFRLAVKPPLAEFDQYQFRVIVASSRGGGIAMNLKNGTAKLVLLCPALKNRGTVKTVKPGTVILQIRVDMK